MDTPGIEVRPIKDMTTNRHFCEVFFTDVRVPGANLVGVEGAAFKQTMRQLEHERGGIDRLVSNHALYLLAARPGRHDGPARAPGDRGARDSATGSAGSSSSARCCKQAPAGFSAATKCFCTEHEQRVAEFVARTLGAEATLWNDVTQRPHLRARLHDHGRHVERDAQHPRRARPRPPASPADDRSANSARRRTVDPQGFGKTSVATPTASTSSRGLAGRTIVGGDGVLADRRRRAADPRRRRRGDRANIGHGRTEVADAVRDALDGGAYVIPIWPTPHRDRAARRARRALAARRAWATSSSPAAAASRPTRRCAWPAPTTWPAGRPERWKVIGRHPSYHGLTLGALAVGSHSGRRAGYEPLLLDFPKVPWDDAAAVAERRSSGRAPTPSPASCSSRSPAPPAPASTPPDEYWRAVEDVCRRHDILLIADEVMTGFGRTGRRWGHEHFPIRPDVLYGGKGLGGGYVPIGMVAATDEIVDRAARQRLHVLHVHRQRRDVRRRRRRARRDRGRAPRRTLGGDGRVLGARLARRARRPPGTSSTSAAAACSAASS